MEKIISIVHAF